MFKSGYVTIIGRPNVGKSTLLNHFMKEKLSIVSNKPQTTRNNVKAILTEEEYQVIFVDTPGIHKPRHKLGEYMVKIAEDSIKEVDVVIFITTPQDIVSKADKAILEQLKDKNVPVFFVLNKTDENTQDKVAKTLVNYSKEYDFKEIIPISALRSRNVDELLGLIVKYLPEGPMFYPEDMISDVNERFVVTEIIREKALKLLDEEVPHGIAVEIVSMKEEEKITRIEANLICEKESHKGIIIGSGGSMLKRISQYSEDDIKKFLQKNVNLKIWVKVRKEWRDNPLFLKSYGYK